MGGKSGHTAGYRFKLRHHSGLTYGPIDALLEYRGGDRTAWSGRLSVSGTIAVNAPKLFGGDKDQGGVVGNLYLMMGEADQVPNPMLVSALGDHTCAWRGFATVAFDGLYGSNNPYPQPQSYKIEKILEGWDNDVCWYSEKARIPFGAGQLLSEVLAPLQDFNANNAATTPEGSIDTFSIEDLRPEDTVTVSVADGGSYAAWSRWLGYGGGSGYYGGSEADPLWWCSFSVKNAEGEVTAYLPTSYMTSEEAFAAALASPAIQLTGSASYAIWLPDDFLSNRGGLTLRISVTRPSQSLAINPAHALYYLRTQSHKGGEPTANIDDASFAAAADRLYAEGFGICVRHDPDQESVEDVENRICKLIGGSVNRNPVDGTLHLDLARGDYVLDDLPVVTDDDILAFSESPTTPEGAINSVSVRFFDPDRKETIITPSVDALGLIDEFGLNHQVIDCPEIPVWSLAARIATRELLQFITPSRAFDLVCKPSVYALQPNQYFRLQTPKRGIADMVCIAGEKQGGTLKSGATRLQVAQVADTLPDFTSIDMETGVDPTPPSTPVAIASQIAFEAPYVNVSAAFSAADRAMLTADVGFLVAAAEDPATSRDFTLAVDAGAGYETVADGDWCPTLVINEAAALEDPLPTDFTFSGSARLGDVPVGALALWGAELCRLDALDIDAGTLTLGRACGDTVPQEHAAGEKVWFYVEGSAQDSTQYTDGETVAAKLLTNTFTQELDITAAPAIDVTFAMRQVRPYPPGQFKIDGNYYPSANAATPSMLVTCAHRDRVMQADQLVDTLAASVGPESTVRYGLRCLNAATSALIIERLDLAGPSAEVILNFTGNIKVQLYSISSNGESWQRHEHTLAYTPPAGTTVSSISGTAYRPPVTIIYGGKTGT